MPDDVAFEARVTRYNIARVRIGQMLLPVAMVTAIAARRFPSAFTAILAFGVQGLIAAFFFSAMKRFGWQRLVFQHGKLAIGATDVRIEKYSVKRWTMVNGLARIYGLDQSYKLRTRRGAEEEFSEFLAGRFGPPTIIRRRGSFRARMIALSVCIAGAAAMTSGIIFESFLLVGIGTPACVFGLAAFGMLTQRTA